MLRVRARVLAGLLSSLVPGLALAGVCGPTFVTSCPENTIYVEGCRHPREGRRLRRPCRGGRIRAGTPR